MRLKNTISHPKCFDKNSGNTSISNYRISIEQCLRLLLTTSRGELLGDPYYGTNLMTFVNEPNDLILRDEIIDDFVYSIKKYERRISVSEEDIIIDIDGKNVNIKINYKITQLGTYETFELSVLRGDYDVQ